MYKQPTKLKQCVQQSVHSEKKAGHLHQNRLAYASKFTHQNPPGNVNKFTNDESIYQYILVN